MRYLPILVLVSMFVCGLFDCGVHAQAEEQDKTGSQRLQFAEAADTNLAQLLTARRLELEKRTGSPLKGHAWWLWGLSTFDFDRDGDLDLVVCIHGGRGGVILKNLLTETGKLTFADATAELGINGVMPATDNYPLLWDFNGDGYVDIAGLFDDTKTSCLINRQGKRFEVANFSLHPINYPSEIRDLNHDGFVDIRQVGKNEETTALYDVNSQSFEVTRAPHRPRKMLPDDVQQELAELVLVPANRFVKQWLIEVGDLDGDGRPDLAAAAFGSYGGARLGYYMAGGPEGSYFERTSAWGLPREGTPLLARDLDTDGDIDLLITSGQEAGLYLNDGKGKFTRQSGPLSDFVAQRCPYLHHVQTADFDQDGDIDLAISNRRYGREQVFENLGAGQFQVALSERGWDADPLVLADINNDGKLDVIVGGSGDFEKKENIGVFLNRSEVGRGCWLYPRMSQPNVYAVGTRIEAFAAGTMRSDRPIVLVDTLAPTAGLPVLVGLGDAEKFDLRITFPGHEPREHLNVAAAERLEVHPDGEIKPYEPPTSSD